MSQFPGVSVVIPTYNRAELLRAALESVLAQTAPATEIAVVDDGSTDHTAQVVEELVTMGAPLIFLQGPHTNNRGEARNRGVEATSAPIVAFLDADDLWQPERLERQLETLSRAPEAGFAFCNCRRFSDDGFLIEPCLDPAADFNGEILGDLLEEPRAVSSTLMLKREVFLKVGGFADLRMNEDYELTLRLAAQYTASYVPEVLMLMREHQGRVSRQEPELPLLDYLTIVGGFLVSHPDLPPKTRAHGRRGLANVHIKLARLYLEHGERAKARLHVGAAMKLQPWDRRAMQILVRSWSPALSSQTP